MPNRNCIIPLLLSLVLRAASQTATIEVWLYDRAGLSPVAVHSFIKETQEIFSSARVSLHLDTCARSEACEDSKPARILMLRIVPGRSRQMNNVMRSPLGRSFADQTGGSYASVFLESVQLQAANNDVPWLTVLAYAAGHEIGHLLLGDQAHTPRGLMKAHWDKDDFRDMKQKRLHFTLDQLRQLERCCASLSAQTGKFDEH